jgi:putative ATP-dependent endonuclease of OLD family
MRISRIQVHNFRNFKDLDLETGSQAVIVGDNKIGKSNLIYALRLILDPSLPDSVRQLRREDFWDGLPRPLSINDKILISINFTDFEDNPSQLALLGAYLIEPSPMVARLTYVFQPKEGLDGAPTRESDYEFFIFGGIRPEDRIRHEIRARMPLDFLPALRDVESDFMNWRRSPLRLLLDESTSKITQGNLDGIAAKVSEATNTLKEEPEIKALDAQIGVKLKDMVGSYQAIETSLGFTPTDPEHLIRALRLFIDGGKRGIGDASLGSANILYIVLKLLELELLDAQKSRDHTFLAIEEPEAHLHPHLQRLIYKGVLNPRAHQVQSTHKETSEELSSKTILLTTHSPHIVSVSPLRSLIILRKSIHDNATEGISTVNLDISDDEIADLERYIDVTRGEIVFAKGVLLVEGDAEVFLIPALSKLLDKDLDELGISVCSVSSANFKPYVKFLGPNGLNKPFAVLTDFDPQSDGSNLGESRIKELLSCLGSHDMSCGDIEKLAKENGLFLNNYTLEIDLFVDGQHDAICQTIIELSDNQKAIERAKGWRASPKSLDEEQLLKDIAHISKGRFAQRLAKRIAGTSCPQYIADAINYVCASCR